MATVGELPQRQKKAKEKEAPKEKVKASFQTTADPAKAADKSWAATS